MSYHFNRLLPAEAERLALLSEECGEVIQIIGKILRHGYDSHNPTLHGGPTNRYLLETELGHVAAALELMVHERDIGGTTIDAAMHQKLEKVQRYMHHQPTELFTRLLLKHNS